LEAWYSRGKVLQLELGRELLKVRRPELIPTVGHRGCMVSDPKVQILDTLEEMVHDGMGGINP
jgi:hypothetical protein